MRLRALAVGATAFLAACGGRDPVGHHVVVLGFDGMDYALTRRMIDEGKLPNLQRMEQSGRFSALETSLTPQSPVAWSDFVTGMDAGGHGIFDFTHRDPETMVPYLSTTFIEPVGRTLTLGSWQLPLSGGDIVLMRQGTPFWEPLEDAGVETTIVRMPANYPVSGTATRELSGMGTPDLVGGYGTYSLYTTAPERLGGSPAGDVHRAEIRRGTFTAALRGPPNPLLIEPEDLWSEFTVYLDPVRPTVKIEIGDEDVILEEGDWSEWVPIEYPLPLFQVLPGMVRFHLKQVRPEFQLYASPVNIDPLDQASPVSHPDDFATQLAEGGRFYTQGMPEDTDAFLDGTFDYDEFLAQADLSSSEFKGQYETLLADFEDGFLFSYFGFLDQVSHALWKVMDPEHPQYAEERDGPYADVIEELYTEADEIVGETLDRLAELGGGGTLIVMSDHGFASFRREFNLNSWLEQNGYLTVLDPNRRDLDFLSNVDWANTRAYQIGLGGLYLNLEGREPDGIVPPAEADALLAEITAGLLAEVDPETNEPAITRVYGHDEYASLGYPEIAPDLVIGFANGTRSSGASAAGAIPAEIMTDNLDDWSGDHIMDHETVPGVLFSNRELQRPVRSLKELAAAVLAEFGVDGFPADGGNR